jgi:hypothetical protein
MPATINGALRSAGWDNLPVTAKAPPQMQARQRKVRMRFKVLGM